MGREILGVLLAASAMSARALPSLETLAGVGEVMVDSAHPGVPEDALRKHVQLRLSKSGLLVEPNTESSGRFLVEVAVVRSPSADGGCTYTAYEVRATLEEPASLHRSPGAVAHAVTWRGAGRVSSFSGEISAESVMELVDNELKSFIRYVLLAQRRP